jgi:nucleotide-binding universal stress UspA family protein
MFKHLLFPTDGSPFSQLVIRRMAGLIPPGSRVSVLHVFQAPTRGQVRFGDQWPAELADAQREAQAIVDAAGTELRVLGVEHVEAVTFEGQPGPTICDVAGLLECDAIIMGTHGSSGFGNLLAGGVSSYISGHAEHPVLLVRPELSSLTALEAGQVGTATGVSARGPT